MMLKSTSGFGVVGAVLLLSCFGLAACSPKGSAAAPAAPGAPTSGPDTLITDPATIPGAKVGYWELVDNEQGKPPRTSRFCEKGKPLWVQFVDPTGCFSYRLKHNYRGDFVAEGACSLNGVTTTERFVFHGDYNQAYKVDQQEDVAATGTHTHNHEAYRYLAPSCPADGATGK